MKKPKKKTQRFDLKSNDQFKINMLNIGCLKTPYRALGNNKTPLCGS